MFTHNIHSLPRPTLLEFTLSPFLRYSSPQVFMMITKMIMTVMVEGPAVGKAGDSLDWIAGGLEIKELKDLGNPCPL